MAQTTRLASFGPVFVIAVIRGKGGGCPSCYPVWKHKKRVKKTTYVVVAGLSLGGHGERWW